MRHESQLPRLAITDCSLDRQSFVPLYQQDQAISYWIGLNMATLPPVI